MRALGLCCMWVVASMGCQFPPIDLSLGSIDSGATAGGGGGSTATGGGEGSSPPWIFSLADAGFVPTEGSLTEAECGRTVAIDTSCGTTGENCLQFKPNGYPAQQLTAPSSAQRVVGVTTDGALVKFSGYDVMEVNRSGVTRTLFATNATQFSVSGVVSEPLVGTWFVTSTTFSANAGLSLAAPGTDLATYVDSLPSLPTAEGFALGQRYVTALADGIHEYGRGVTSVRLYEVPNGKVITHLASSGSEIVFLQCESVAKYPCEVHELSRSTLTARKLFSVPTAMLGAEYGGGHALQYLNGAYYFLGTQALVRFRVTDGVIETVYRNRTTPEWDGTLKWASLVTRGSKLYFGGLCHNDVDHPGYGTLELDPVTRQARWLQLDPAWPSVPYLVAYEVDRVEGPIWAHSPYGVFLGAP